MWIGVRKDESWLLCSSRAEELIYARWKVRNTNVKMNEVTAKNALLSFLLLS